MTVADELGMRSLAAVSGSASPEVTELTLLLPSTCSPPLGRS